MSSVNCNSTKSENTTLSRFHWKSSRFVKYVHKRELWTSHQSSGDASLRNSDRTESGMLGKYINGFPTKRRSLAVDRQRGARCFIVSSLLAIPPALCTRIWLSLPRHGLQITWRRRAAKRNVVEFSIHCEQPRNWTPPLRWKYP